jgi:hypothetical protein
VVTSVAGRVCVLVVVYDVVRLVVADMYCVWHAVDSVRVVVGVVVVAGVSVWVPTLSKMATGMKQCRPWPAAFHRSCSSYSPLTIPFP